MDPSGNQGLGNRSRQISRKGMRLCGARIKSPPGEKIGSGIRVTFPEIQKRSEGHELSFGPVQNTKGNCAHTERQPKGDAAISQRDNDCLTPWNTQGGECQRHDAFDDANA